MVWIHGGAYSIGMSSLPSTTAAASPATAGRRGDVQLPRRDRGFGQIEGAPANRGLLDQVAALKWVQ
jgi:para-nitrobenzyl esterase